MLTRCCDTALRRSQKSRHTFLGCTQRENIPEMEMLSQAPWPTAQNWIRGRSWEVGEWWGHWEHAASSPYTCATTLWVTLEKDEEKRVLGTRLAGENEPGQTHKNSHNCLKPLWHSPASCYCNPTDPGWSTLPLSPTPGPLPSASSPALLDCASLTQSFNCPGIL